jgi:hypothetical protein
VAIDFRRLSLLLAKLTKNAISRQVFFDEAELGAVFGTIASNY